jgi:hypothetical protein
MFVSIYRPGAIRMIADAMKLRLVAMDMTPGTDFGEDRATAEALLVEMSAHAMLNDFLDKLSVKVEEAGIRVRASTSIEPKRIKEEPYVDHTQWHAIVHTEPRILVRYSLGAVDLYEPIIIKDNDDDDVDPFSADIACRSASMDYLVDQVMKRLMP